jgi:tRNA(Ile)-lysidine synthase
MALMVLAREAGVGGVVIHVDHGLRSGSSAEGTVVEMAARPLGFDFRAERVAVPEGPDLEARARRARYAVLPPGVLTGHTMDDQAETVLLNLVRGAGLDGLAGMRPSSGMGSTGSATHHVVRPLLGIRRSETAEVCRRAGLTPLADPSNTDLRFRRNRVRAELVPLMSRIADRDVVPVLARQASLMAADAGFLDDQAARLDPTDVRALREAPAVLARRALRAWLRSGPGFHPPSSAELGRVMDVVQGRATACELSGGRRVTRSRGRLSVSPAPAPGLPERTPDTRGKGPT